MAKAINTIFRLSVLINYLSSVGIICLVGFLAKQGTSLTDISKFLALLLFEVLQVLLITYFGDLLKRYVWKVKNFL